MIRLFASISDNAPIATTIAHMYIPTTSLPRPRYSSWIVAFRLAKHHVISCDHYQRRPDQNAAVSVSATKKAAITMVAP